MTVLLQLTGVSKANGALKAVDTVDLAVEGVEALAVIGPNGAGKTTLFNLITGDVAPSSGRVLFDGEPTKHFQSRRAAEHRAREISRRRGLQDARITVERSAPVDFTSPRMTLVVRNGIDEPTTGKAQQ